MATIKQLNAENFEATIAQGVVMVDFWATWCNPCKMLGTILEKLAPEAPENVIIGKVNVEDAPELAAQYGVTSIPRILVMVNGKIVEDMTGLQSKPKILAVLNSAVESLN